MFISFVQHPALSNPRLPNLQLPGTALTHVTNQNDPVPTVPPRFLGFQHPQGEVHIQAVDANGNATDVVSCAGQENEVRFPILYECLGH